MKLKNEIVLDDIMNKARENYLWNVVYGNTGFTHFNSKEKAKAEKELLKWYKSKEYDKLKQK